MLQTGGSAAQIIDLPLSVPEPGRTAMLVLSVMVLARRVR